VEVLDLEDGSHPGILGGRDKARQSCAETDNSRQ
jgi:hypothetical protein